jgi:Bifunctional DNA primase/polymerase, N-terminal
VPVPCGSPSPAVPSAACTAAAAAATRGSSWYSAGRVLAHRQRLDEGAQLAGQCRQLGGQRLAVQRRCRLDQPRLVARGRWPRPDTFTVTTANGGLHLYFTAPAARVVVNTIGGQGPGIDFRAPGRTSGGYVVGPGSVVDGRAYVIDRDLPIAPLSNWLVQRLCPSRTRIRFGAKTGDVRVTTGRPGAGRFG